MQEHARVQGYSSAQHTHTHTHTHGCLMLGAAEITRTGIDSCPPHASEHVLGLAARGNQTTCKQSVLTHSPGVTKTSFSYVPGRTEIIR
eukprot:4417362-Amphidinium_carterae.2